MEHPSSSAELYDAMDAFKDADETAFFADADEPTHRPDEPTLDPRPDGPSSRTSPPFANRRLDLHPHGMP